MRKNDKRQIWIYSISCDNWSTERFEDLKRGNIFYITENGKRFHDTSGNNVWIAMASPYINPNGILQVDTIY